MKHTGIKTYVLTILQIPVLLAQLIVAYLDLLLERCRFHLDASRPQDCTDVDTPDIHKLFSKEPDWLIRRIRGKLERTDWGGIVARNETDRHLYAVLVPTRQEDIRRIENVFAVLPRARQRQLIVEFEKLLQGCKNESNA